MRLILYNQLVPSRRLGLLCLTVFLCACGGPAQNKDAVRKGILEYLSKRSDMVLSSMDVEVVSVSFRKGEADATVSFRAKGSASGGMQMNYTLTAEGRQWVVKNKREGGASPHGDGATANPHGAAPEGGSAAPGGATPPGHPPIGGTAPADKDPAAGSKK